MGKIEESKEVVAKVREAMIATSHCTVNGEECAYCQQEVIDQLWQLHKDDIITIHEIYKPWEIRT